MPILSSHDVSAESAELLWSLDGREGVIRSLRPVELELGHSGGARLAGQGEAERLGGDEGKRLLHAVTVGFALGDFAPRGTVPDFEHVGLFQAGPDVGLIQAETRDGSGLTEVDFEPGRCRGGGCAPPFRTRAIERVRGDTVRQLGGRGGRPNPWGRMLCRSSAGGTRTCEARSRPGNRVATG